ncbi:MAG: hypothetical protein ACKVU1_10830 [bacterium]
MRRTNVGAILILGALALSGCASSGARRGYLVSPADAQRETYGAWVTIDTRAAETPAHRWRGELIAIEADSIFLHDGNSLVGLAIARVKKAKIAAYSSPAAVGGGWALAGLLSTGSHGFGLLISAPVWILTGIFTSAAMSYEPITTISSQSRGIGEGVDPRDVELGIAREHWQSFYAARKFARFPQGLPPELDRASLQTKPLPPPPRSRQGGRGIVR